MPAAIASPPKHFLTVSLRLYYVHYPCYPFNSTFCAATSACRSRRRPLQRPRKLGMSQAQVWLTNQPIADISGIVGKITLTTKLYVLPQPTPDFSHLPGGIFFATAPDGLLVGKDCCPLLCGAGDWRNTNDVGSKSCRSPRIEGLEQTGCTTEPCPCQRVLKLLVKSRQSLSPARTFFPPVEDRSCPGSPACPGNCHLCDSGNVPFCFTPAVVIQPLGCLGRVNADALLHVWQPHPEELIRPPRA